MTEAPTSDGAQRPNSDPMNAEQLLSSIAFENEDLLAKVTAIVATAEEWGKLDTLRDAEDAEDLTNFMSQVGNALDMADKRRDLRKRPYDECAKVVQKFFKEKAIDLLVSKKEALKKKLLVPYLEKVKKANEAEAARRAAAAQAAIDAAKTPEEVKVATKDLKSAKTFAKSTGIKTDFGAKTHLTMTWSYEVMDIAKVPAKYLVVDNAALMAVIRTGTEEKPVEIPGILVKRVANSAGG